MSENGSDPLMDIFDECLVELEAGTPVEAIIAARPAHADELQVLLETAGLARSLQPEDAPRSAQLRGRTRLLVQAERLRRARPQRRTRWNWQRLALQLTAFVAIVALSLTSLVAASAQSLPGDSLYTVKRAAEEVRLSTTGEGGRSALQNTLRDRRIEEVRELLRLRRPSPVSFEGVVTSIGDSAWEVAGLQIIVTADTGFNGDILPGMFVEVRGRTTAEGRLIAEWIYLRAYAFTGALLARSGAIWQVDAVPVLITPETQLAPDLALGDQVVVLAQVDDDGTISARAVLLGQQIDPEPAEPVPSITPGSPTPASATPPPTPTATAVQQETPEPEPDPDPEVEDETETEDDEDETETEEPEEDETEKPDDSGPGGGDDD